MALRLIYCTYLSCGFIIKSIVYILVLYRLKMRYEWHSWFNEWLASRLHSVT